MAGEETRPVDLQVARPVAAPNYVGMYSERVKAALEPYEYLLNYQKELSDEDYKKAEIQNFLSEHDLKTKQLSEDVRSHTADEAIRNLTEQTNAARQVEEARHNVVDERRADRESDLQEWRDLEVQRHNEATEAAEKKTLELTSSLHDSDIKKNDADTEWLKTQTQLKTTEDAQRTQDQQVIQDMDKYISGIKPEDLWNINENPEIQQKIDEARASLHTQEAKTQFNQMVGAKQALGQSDADHKAYNNLSPEARKTFSSAMLQSDSSTPIQLRWNDALNAAGQTQAQVNARGSWSQAGITAEQNALAEHKSPQEAFVAGRDADAQWKSDLKAKEDLKPEPKMVDQLQTQLDQLYRARYPQNKGEKNADYDSRIKSMIGAQAVELEQDSRVNRPVFMQKLKMLDIDPNSLSMGEAQTGQKSTVQPGVTPAPASSPVPAPSPTGQITPASAWLKKILPGSDQKASGSPKTTEMQYGGGTTSALPTTTAFGNAPQYAAATENTDEFSNLFSKLFSAKDTSGEETPSTLA